MPNMRYLKSIEYWVVDHMMNTDACKIDWDFINSSEGLSKQGYVPCDEKGNVIGNSGCTVGYGFDIGQQTATGLLAYQFSADLYKLLLPYTEKRGELAKQFVSKYPLYLSSDAASEVTDKLHTHFATMISTEYNAYSDFRFEFLKTAQQTAIMDLAYQYGSLKSKCPRFFKMITTGQWKQAVEELKNFGDAYPTRRKREADLLASSL